MCGSEGGWGAQAAVPRAAPGPAVDRIQLEPVDEITLTTLVDNVYDGLLASTAQIERAAIAAGQTPAKQFTDGVGLLGMRAEHGFSAHVTVATQGRSSSLIFDTGLSPDAMLDNADRLGIDLSDVRGVILSHGHFDHAGGLLGLAARQGQARMPMTIHPFAWTRRRFASPDGSFMLPTLSRTALAAEGFDLIERRTPSLLLDGSVLITGEIDRTTDFEHGMPPAHQAWDGTAWQPDPTVIDDQALIVHLRDRGLVIVTGCGHAGVVNIVRHAMRLTGVDRLHALFGGFHLGGPAFEPIIPATVDALSEAKPQLLVAGHCTGWRAQHALAAALPQAWQPPSSGSRYRMHPEVA